MEISRISATIECLFSFNKHFALFQYYISDRSFPTMNLNKVLVVTLRHALICKEIPSDGWIAFKF